MRPLTLFDNMEAWAAFNNDRTHRYLLVREWDANLKSIAFIGLNPSTADELEDDNTIKKVVKIAKHNGYGGLFMLNLFSYVSTDPKKLIQCGDNKENDGFIKTYAMAAEKTVFAWGNFKQAKERAKEVEKLLQYQCFCLAKNKNGSPKHPLYCYDNNEIIPYTPF